MREHEPSRTAAWVAVTRGLGVLLPAEARLIDDPYGIAFASADLTGRLATAVHRHGARMLANLPGMRTWLGYMQVRTRVLDDAVREFVAAGGRQLVLLGAGYDCRALRLPELTDSRVFEIDHPATQARKRAVLARVGVSSTARYLAWDFQGRAMAELPAAMHAIGHDATAPTLTIWEGVTMYLSEDAIDASLRTIAAYSAPGSVLAMTYFSRTRIAKPSLSTRGMMRMLGRIGEPWTWGWDPAELPTWMAARGFVVEADVDMGDAARRMLPARYALPSDGRHVAISARERIALTARR